MKKLQKLLIKYQQNKILREKYCKNLPTIHVLYLFRGQSVN